MFAFAKSKFNNITCAGLVLRIAISTSLMFVGLSAQAQSAACAANESLQTFSFAAPNNWPAGAAGPLTFTLGAGANAVTITATATLADIVAGNPVTAASGTFADSVFFLVDRTVIGNTNALNLIFSKPVNNMRLVITDIDSNDQGTGKYQDAITITGTGPSGAVTPTATATSPLVVITGNTATSSATATNAQNCDTTTSAQCNATFNYTAPVTAVSMTYFNGPTAYGNPPNQAIGVAGMGFCVQNPDLALVKDDGSVSFVAGGTGLYTFSVSNVGSAATSGSTTIKDILPAGMSFTAPLTAGGANGAALTCSVSTTTVSSDTATCTTTTPIAAGATGVFTLPVSVASTVASGLTLTNRAKVFGGNDPNKPAETTTGAISACGSDGLAGAVANAGCGLEATPITAAANIVIAKTDNKTTATSGGTNNYVVTLTNQGPSVANDVIITDVVGAGLTCPGTNAVTCTVTGAGAVCPAEPLTIANLTGAGITVATLPVNGALQVAYTCNAN